jgi:DDE superfamily endonuclease
MLAQDEGCFGRISQVKRAWAPPGMRPHVPVQVIREYMYVYAAVAPAQGQMVSLMLPETSTAMMNLFLEHVSRSFPEHFIVMQVDQAGWHRSQELFIPANIRLIPQPAYSPEVNPVKSGSGMPHCAGSLGFHVVSMLTTWNPRLPASSCFLTCTL